MLSSDYYLVISIMCVLLLLILFYRNFIFISQNKGTNTDKKTITQVYTLETMSNPIDSFCDHYESIPSELKSEAEKLTKDNCIQSKCTVWLNDTKCVAGNASGPTYITENDVKVDIDNYYYMNQCYGKNCP